VSDDPIARVDGDLVFMLAAIASANLLGAARLHSERIRHFQNRMAVLGRSAADTIITVLNGDDPIGAKIASLLMPPGWDTEFRACGQIPYARGLAERVGLEALMNQAAPTVAALMAEITGVIVLVADHGTITAFDIAEILS